MNRQKKCVECGSVFYKPGQYSIKQWEGKFLCGNICKSIWRHKTFRLSEESRSKISQTLKNNPNRNILRGERHGNWNGGFYVQDGHMRQSNSLGSKMRARVIAERCLGRFLRKREIVHHINENKMDDRPENLFVFRHVSAHLRWHHFLRRHGLDGVVLVSNIVGANI